MVLTTTSLCHCRIDVIVAALACGCRLIDAEEFRPMLKHLWPSQKEFATAHAKDILEQVWVQYPMLACIPTC